MTRPTPPIGTAQGQVRWWVAPEYLRPTRFGEPAIAGIVWAVRPVIGQGAHRHAIGGPAYFATRTKALDHAHTKARRTYGTPRNRKDHP